jgi:hypothetical protein
VECEAVYWNPSSCSCYTNSDELEAWGQRLESGAGGFSGGDLEKAKGLLQGWDLASNCSLV